MKPLLAKNIKRSHNFAWNLFIAKYQVSLQLSRFILLKEKKNLNRKQWIKYCNLNDNTVQVHRLLK